MIIYANYVAIGCRSETYKLSIAFLVFLKELIFIMIKLNYSNLIAADTKDK